MPLDFQLVQAPFRFGVEEGVDPKQVPFGTLLTAENVEWVKSGRLQKRNGISALTQDISGGGTISAAKRLVVRGDELALIDGSKLYSYQASGWIDRGKLPELGLEWSTQKDDPRGILAFDMALLSSGQLVRTWVCGTPSERDVAGQVWMDIIDLETGTVITSPAILNSAGGHKIRVVTDGTNWVILYTAGGSLFARTASGTTTLQSDAEADVEFGSLDACVIGSQWVVAYALEAGGIELRRYSFAGTPALQASAAVTGETEVTYQAISICGASGETLYITFSDSTAGEIRFAAANPSTLAQTVAPVAVDDASDSDFSAESTLGVIRTSSTTCRLFYSLVGNNSFDGGVMKAVTITNAGVVSALGTWNMTRLLSRPIAIGSRYYCAVSTFVKTQAVDNISTAETFIVEAMFTTAGWQSLRQVGKVDWLIGGYWSPGFCTEMIAVSSTRTIVAMPYVNSSTGLDPTSASAGVYFRQGVRLTNLLSGADLPDDMWRSTSIGPETYLAAGVLTAYDGIEAIGYGWAHPFYIDEAEFAASAMGGTMATGDYTYCLVGERRSNVGVLHRAPPGVPVTIAVTGPTGSVTVAAVSQSIGTSALVSGGGGPTTGLVAVYRSVVDGSIPQRLTLEPQDTVLYNAPASNFIYTVDTHADANIISAVGYTIALSTRPAMYTEGGELADWQPPGFVNVCLYRNRLFGILGDRQTVVFSKNHSANPGTAPGFNPDLRFDFNDVLTGLAVLDERLIVFSETGIYTLAGDGPAPNGDGADYGEPNKLQTDVGCTNARGLVSGADGVYFVSNGEIHMLDRSLIVQWVGKPVQDLLDSFPNVTSAVLVSKKNHVRFSCNNNAGTAGVVLVFDYVERQWSVFKYAVTAGNGVPIADACMHGGVYTFVTTAGVVYKESAATWLDAGSWVTAKIETAWVHAAGPLAYQSIRNFRIDGVGMTAHGISISVGFDGNTTYQQGPETWAEGVSGVTSPGDSVTANISIGTRRKCRSIRFKVQDSAPVSLGTGQGAKWSSMGIEVGVKRGLGRLAERQKG